MIITTVLSYTIGYAFLGFLALSILIITFFPHQFLYPDVNLQKPGYFEIGIIILLVLAFLVNVFNTIKSSIEGSKKRTDFNEVYNGNLLIIPFRNLNEGEKKFLRKNYKISLSMSKSLFILIPLFSIIEFILLFSFLTTIASFFTLIIFGFVCVLHYAFIKVGSTYNNIYLDLQLPVYKTTGILTLPNTDNTSSFTVNGIVFNSLLPNHNSTTLKNGKKVEIIFSYFSKTIWDIKYIGD